METFRRYSKRVYIPVYLKRHTTGRLIFLRFFKVPLRAGGIIFSPAPVIFFTVSLLFNVAIDSAGKSAYKKESKSIFFFLGDKLFSVKKKKKKKWISRIISHEKTIRFLDKILIRFENGRRDWTGKLRIEDWIRANVSH